MINIILVEDDPMISEIYKKKFSSSGINLTVAANGKSVLKELRAGKFDLILLDLVLPEMSGMDILKEIRGGEYDPDLKIYIFSNLNVKDNIDEAISIGANGFISKSDFSPSDLVGKVKDIIKESDSSNGNEPISEIKK